MAGQRVRRAGLAILAAALLGGCAGTSAAAPPPPPAPPPAAPTITISPIDGAADVAPASPIKVDVVGGTLTDMALTAADGKVDRGTLSPDSHAWTASTPPAYDTAYRITGTASGPGGTVPVAGGFTTVDPKRLVKATMNIANGATVGIAAPIDIRFDRRIAEADRPAAERALRVSTSVPVEGSWAWLPDVGRGSRVHWRPATYWPSGTKVTVAARVFGVDLGQGGYGAADLNRSFTIGRAQIVKADITSHRVVVVRDGQVVSDLAASYGMENDRRRVTRSGVHIVMGKSRTVLMTNPAFDYQDVPMHWAVRISDNGEFIHANPASAYAWGKKNVTHGCVNLSPANARTYFDMALYGDPVEVTGSSVPLSADDGDVYDWAVPWAEWKAMSALD